MLGLGPGHLPRRIRVVWKVPWSIGPCALCVWCAIGPELGYRAACVLVRLIVFLIKTALQLPRMAMGGIMCLAALGRLALVVRAPRGRFSTPQPHLGVVLESRSRSVLLGLLPPAICTRFCRASYFIGILGVIDQPIGQSKLRAK